MNKLLATPRWKAGPDDKLDEGVFTAYASVFGNVDSYGDVVEVGAFTKTLDKWRDSGDPIPVLFGHNFHDPDYNIGVITDAKEDKHGLLVTGKLDLDAPKARQVYRLIKGRRVKEMSFGFTVTDSASEVSDGVHLTKLKELDLKEISIVPMGANPATEIVDVKAGRTISASTADKLASVRDNLTEAVAALDSVLKSGSADSSTSEADEKSAPSDAAPVKTSVEEPRPQLDAATLQLRAKLLDLTLKG